MRVNSINNINFSRLFISKNIRGSQNIVAKNISNKLCQTALNGKSYIDAIEEIGYDVIIIKSELYNPEAIRIGIIKDMKSHQLCDGSYIYLDARIIQQEAYINFSPKTFYDKVKQRTAKSKFDLKKFFNFLKFPID